MRRHCPAKKSRVASFKAAPSLFFIGKRGSTDFQNTFLDAGMALLTMGLARHYKKYEKEQPEEERGQYSFAEIEAWGKRVGLWADAEPVPPWE
jgi:endonuclease YncB( thermonuclease family)